LRTSIVVVLATLAAPSLAAPRAAATENAAPFAGLAFRSIGPAHMGGRVADVEGVPGSPRIVYVGSASGGVWKTTNGGVSWSPLFDKQAVASIGDIALEPGNPDVLYVGTGESAVRNSVSFGDGVYKSTDGGASFKHLGLGDTEHVSRIAIDPRDPRRVYVAALGHAFGPSKERGVFMSANGGETWEKVLFTDDRHGASDLDVDPENPNLVYAALWKFERKPWTHTSGDAEGGAFKSVDAGRTWKKLEKGLPKLLGRIAVRVAPSRPEVVYVLAESNEGTLYRSTDHGETFVEVNRDPNIVNRGFYYTQLRLDPTNEDRLYAVAGNLQLSVDGGKTFKRISRSTHVDFHALWIDPRDPARMWQGEDGGLAVSYDRGERWEYVNNVPIGQFYQVTADNREPFYYLGGGLQDNGTWWGPSRTREPFGILNDDWRMVSFGDGFHLVAHPEIPDLFLSEYQGGGIVRTDMKTRGFQDVSPQPRRNDGGPVNALKVRFNWNSPIVASPHDGKTVYFAGNVVFRSRDFGLHWEAISPDLTTNDPEKQKVAGGPVFTENTTAEYHCTIISLAESPKEPGVLWAGTDDGKLQVSRDGGQGWANVIPTGMKPFSPVSHVEASRTAAGTAYAAFDRHMFDDFKPYVFKTTDFGKTWTNVSGNLPERAYVQVVREDPRNPSVLYAGTEIGLYVSWTGGGTWTRLHLKNLPPVSIHDILVHPRDNDLILATHGRALWVLDDATPIQQATAEVLGRPLHLFPVRSAVRFAQKPTRYGIGDEPFRGENPPYGALVTFSLAEKPAKDTLRLEVLDTASKVVREIKKVPAEAGLNRAAWDLRYEPPRLRKEPDKKEGEEEEEEDEFGPGNRGPQALPGAYRVRLTVGQQTAETPVELRLDPTVAVAAAELQAQFHDALLLRDLRSALNDGLRSLDRVKHELEDRRKLLADKKDASEEAKKGLLARADELDELLNRLARPEGKPFWSEGPRLSERLGSLAGAIDSGNKAPLPPQRELLGELRAELQSAHGDVSRYLTEALRDVNQLLTAQELPPLGIPKPFELPPSLP
jgi:photosystem II stability/assembly factor-like uncharacterized protein